MVLGNIHTTHKLEMSPGRHRVKLRAQTADHDQKHESKNVSRQHNASTNQQSPTNAPQMSIVAEQSPPPIETPHEALPK